ncbi:MAG: DUF262 domain-containing protein [bacterium]|nr:DUF262 domain-containing protein [bacterium]
MKIELNNIKVREVFNGYKDSDEEGVTAYGGKLDIRPKYQREFVYKPEQRNQVIKTIMRGYPAGDAYFPLNTMYWLKTDKNNFEVIDGQQRTLSICQYINGDYSINEKYFHSLNPTEKEYILDYPLQVYICTGSDKERLEWFEIINTAGEILTPQELRNANYTGEWLTDAKRWFSKNGAPAYQIGQNYIKGSPIRQEFLEKALIWISARDFGEEKPAEYMSKHHHDKNANELWGYFQKLIEWISNTFPNYRKEMAGVNWGELYNEFKDKKLDAGELEIEISKLMQDEDVSSKSGIYTYVLTGEERNLSIRAFNEKMKREAYERQKGICVARNAVCKNIHFDISEMEADHMTPWREGGRTTAENCQMLCKLDNRTKSDN